ncbi:MAG: four helix bundle protein [Gemmatimonadetes bacterium]|nr:four helix bundle protein [Gemmatimonadota bacterium]
MSKQPPGPPYERLEAWKACHELAVLLYRATGSWPREERYGLVSQARRAAYSAAANLVEGSARSGTRELARFTAIALGSLSEIEYLILLARDLGIIGEEEWRLLAGHVARAGQLTGGLHRALRRRNN